MVSKMQPRVLQIGGYVAIAAIAAIAGALLWPVLKGPSEEQRRLAESVRILSDERDALKTRIVEAEQETERQRAAAASLEAELESARGDLRELAELRGRTGEIQTEREQTQRKLVEATERTSELEQRVSEMDRSLTAATAEASALRTELNAAREQYQSLEQQHRTLSAEHESLISKLAGAEEELAAAAAGREELSAQLLTTGRTLEEAKSRAAELNTAYEALLREKSELVAMDEARRAELERTKMAFEETQAEVARLTGARGIYTVQRSDSLSRIAAFFYRKAYRWPDIFQANSFLIGDPDLIYPGMVLIIPQ